MSAGFFRQLIHRLRKPAELVGPHRNRGVLLGLTGRFVR